MARNNADRLGVEEDLPKSKGTSTLNKTIQSAAGAQHGAMELPFRFPNPVHVVDLPTKGKFYPKEHPLHNQEDIEVREMSTPDEEILNNQDFIKKGTAIDRVLQSIIVDKRVKLGDLYIGDKNAILISARKNYVNAEYKTGVTCGNCGKSSEEVFNLDELKTKEFSEEDNIEIRSDGTFEVQVEENKVRLRLLKSEDEKAMRMEEEQRKKHKLPSEPIQSLLNCIIVGVNGVEDGYVVNQFISQMPARYSRQIRKLYDKYAPNVDLTYHFECDNCGAESNSRIPFGANFFWTNE